MGMAENYKHLYKQMKKMVAMYQDEIVPGMREQLEKCAEVVRCKDCKHSIWDEKEQMWECLLSVDLTGDSDTYAMFHEYNDGEHFCSYGERKDND